MADALKPCPCCAEDARVYSGRERTVPWFQIGCPFCHLKTLKRRTLDLARAAWNRRAPLAPPTDAEVEAAANCIPDFDRRALTQVHAGDCTKQSGACSRCAAEEILAGVRAALAAFVAGRQGGGT